MYLGVQGSARPGTYALIARALPADLAPSAEGFGACNGLDALGDPLDIGTFQQGGFGLPLAGADPDLGIALPAGAPVVLNAHTYNESGGDSTRPARYRFDAGTENPLPDAALGRTGAASGPVVIGPGDAIEWECVIKNDTEETLKMRDDLETGEMCILYGAVTAVTGDSVPFSCIRN